ncbi:MAG TPA: GTP-binding protein [Methylococcaceae bacterium]|nr:GTP-binding protein [Methylococcaceae bacterium]
MLEFVSLLLQRYQNVLKTTLPSDVNYAYQQRVEQLILAQAFLTKGRHLNALPLQIAVIGPTQAGKSSLVNVLLQSSLAGVSPLAGYTVHPQGFCHAIDERNSEPLAAYFAPFVRSLPKQLNKSNYACYTLTQNITLSPYLPPAILWDTPDFDSIDSRVYREGVLKTMALADIIILVVSKEKYADQSVWEMMKCLEPLRQPTIICVNKLNDEAESIILPSLQEKWHDVRRDHFPQVLPLYYQKKTQLPDIAPDQQQVLHALVKKVQREKQATREQKLLQTHWLSWTAPLRDEHLIHAAWQQLVDETIAHTLRDYERDYLNHPRHYDTFQQAIVQLVLLLEIRGVSQVMVSARKALLYPFKKLGQLRRDRGRFASDTQEIVVLKQLIEHTLTQLAHELLDKNTHPLWHEVRLQLRNHHALATKNGFHAAQAYCEAFEQDIEQAAQQLYHQLQAQPLLLNSLRATRVVADVAVLALTFYTGGIGLHDLVIAPAMLMLTQFLTESTLGGYMRNIESALKKQQLAAVKTHIFAPLAQTLHNLPEHINSNHYFAISAQQLADAQTQLNDGKPHGLRLL